MTENRERYVYLNEGTWQYKPTRAMRAAGFRNQGFGHDLEAANEAAGRWNAEWDAIRESAKRANEGELDGFGRGDFRWLCDKFQKDPVWYGTKKPVTQQEIDKAFERVCEEVGDGQVAKFKRRHGRALYNTLREKHTVSACEKTMKWLRRVMTYAREIGIRDDIPVDGLVIEHPASRNTTWTRDEVMAVMSAALHGGTAESGNRIPPRRSISLAIAISYDTSMPQGDVLRLTWDKWDGQGFTIQQQKKRGQRTLYQPVSEDTKAMLNDMVKTGTHIIVCEQTSRPYVDDAESVSQSRRNSFGRLFRKFCERAGVKGKTFHDIRRTALSEMGNNGGTNAEISSQSGHSVGSKMIDVYVHPDKSAAMNMAAKRWSKKDA